MVFSIFLTIYGVDEPELSLNSFGKKKIMLFFSKSSVFNKGIEFIYLTQNL